MENNSEKMNVMGLIGMILGILALVLSFVPCLGVYAIFPGAIGLILSIIGMTKAKKGMAIAGLVCSLIGTGVAAWQAVALNEAGRELEQLDKDLDKLDSEYQKELDNMENDL